MTEGEDRKTVEAVLRGERAAYAVLVDRYKDRVFNLAYRMTGRFSDADDLTQEAFIRAYVNLSRFETEKSFFTWLYTISLNTVRNHLKKRNRDFIDNAVEWAEHVAAGAGPAASDPEGDMNERQLQELLQECLLRLPLDTREAVILRFYQDLSFEETAEILGISLSAAKMRVYRGLEKLKEGLSKKG